MTGWNEDLQVGDYVKFTNDDAWATGTIRKIEEQSGGMWRLVTLAVDSASPPDTWDHEAPTAGGEHGFGLWPGDAPPTMARVKRPTYQSTIDKVSADIAAGRIRVVRHTNDDVVDSIRYAMDALRSGCGHLYRSKVRDTAPAPCPALYDGLTAEQCLELFIEAQRYESEAARKLLTPPRLAAARELWSAQLRAKREAAQEKERRAVTYCEVDSDD